MLIIELDRHQILAYVEVLPQTFDVYLCITSHYKNLTKIQQALLPVPDLNKLLKGVIFRDAQDIAHMVSC